MINWMSYTENRSEHTVVGELIILPDVVSPQLDNQRDILVWLPPSYHESEQHYPVLYMHDGDNLFDAYASYAGEWEVDEALTYLDMEIIVIGIPNMGEQRMVEYNPFKGRGKWQGKGDAYIGFITDTLKPMIDSEFRTLTDAEHTGIAGSSMGGLISLYAFLTRPDMFGLCAALSPVTWLGRKALNRLIRESARGQGRVYLDIGTREGEVYARRNDLDSDSEASRYYRDGVRQLHDSFVQQSYQDNLMYVEDEDALHNEAAWSRRFPDALQFLFVS